ncbi:MAG TPA: MFS transporter [Capillimicrobium sp.]|nr:MFS transporter [Capillimicrobium sp.]
MRSRDFRLVVAAWGLSALGDFLAVAALTLRVEADTGSGFAVAALLVAAGLPLVVLNPLGGWLVDRFETRRLLAATAAGQAVVAAALAAVDGLAATLPLVFLLNAGLTIERPALFALIPRIVGEEAAPRAYAWFESVKYATFTLGMLLGGTLTQAFGAGTALLADAATCALAACAALALRTRRAPAPAGGEAAPEPHAMSAGVRLLWRDRLLRALVAVLAASIVFGGIDNVATVFFARDALGVGGAGYGALVAAWGVGMVAGATVAGRRVTAARAALASLGAVAVMGAGIGLTGASAALAPALAFMVVGGLGNGLNNVAIRVLLQARVEDRLRGRVYAASQGVMAVADFAALAAGGALVELLGARGTLVLAGAGCFAAAVLGLPALRRSGAAVGAARRAG